MEPTVIVRPACLEDVAGLDVLGARPAGTHRRRLSLQRAGAIVYLVACLGERTAGHLVLSWSGANEWALRATITNCPTIIDLFVAPDLRCRGIGTLLLADAEQRAAARGYPRIGLAVGITNLRAYSLYQRLGYRDAGVGTFTVTWTEIGPNGTEDRASETCVYLAKALATTHRQNARQQHARQAMVGDPAERPGRS